MRKRIYSSGLAEKKFTSTMKRPNRISNYNVFSTLNRGNYLETLQCLRTMNLSVSYVILYRPSRVFKA